MARLPDIDNLGARPIARPRMGVASVDNPGAIASSIESLGNVAERIGADQIEKEDKLSYAAATASLLKADAEARLELADDPDYETAEKRYLERIGKARSAASTLIKSKFDRSLFDVDTQTDLDRGSFEVRKVVDNKRKAAKTASFASTMQDLQATGRAAPDDATRETVLKTANDAITGAERDGILAADKAIEARQQFANEYVYSQVASALDKGDIEKARGIYDRFGKSLTTDSFLKLGSALNNEVDAQAVMAASTAGMGKPLVSAPKDVPALVTKLFPNAKVGSITRTRAEQNALIAAGATSAVNSHHLTGHAIDVEPIEGVSFTDYVKTLKANGVNVIEALEESGKGKNQGTGKHWHIAWTDPVAQPPATLEDAISRGVAALGPNATAKQIDQTRGEIAKRWQVAEQADRDREDAVVESVQGMLLKNGGSWYALPASVRASVNPKHVPGLISYGASIQTGANAKTDPVEYVRLTTMAQTDPKGFAKINPIEYRNKFDESDWQSLVGTRAKILGKPEGEDKALPLSEIRSVTGPMLEARGLTLTGITSEKKNDRMDMAGRIYGFEKAIATDVAVWQRNNPGKNPTTRDIQEMADRRLLQTVQADGGSRYQFESPDAPYRIPTADVVRIKRLMTPILGRPPTQAEVRDAYVREARGS